MIDLDTETNERSCKCICGCAKKFVPYISGEFLKRAVQDICVDCYEKQVHQKSEVGGQKSA